MQHARNHIDRVVHSVVGGTVSIDTSVDALIKRSWERCINSFNLEPSPTRAARVLTQQELVEHKARVEDFIAVAKIGIQDLYEQVSPLNYVVLLTDMNGVTVDYIGNPRLDRELRDYSLYLGADWNEQHVGTCGVGICATEMLPVTCHQGDHFDVRNTTLTCSAAPVFDPNGGPLGVLDVSALTSPREKSSQHLLLELVKAQALNIESANFFKNFHPTHHVLRFGRLRDYVNINAPHMLALDEDGTIVGLNSAARRLLCNAETHLSPDWNSAIGHNITRYFRLSGVDANVPIPMLVGRTLQAHTIGDLSDMYINVVAPHKPRRAVGDVGQANVTAIGAAPPAGTADMDQDSEIRISPNRIQQNPAESANSPSPLAGLTGGDPAIARAVRVIEKVVDQKINILLQGETGAGKEVFARAIHAASARSDKPFVAVNCAAIPESLIESELFGYKPGTFTGARTKGMRGLIAQSSGGTLFLDEIGDMPVHLQTRLLRVLSEHELMPLGSEQPVKVDLHVIAATHQDIETQINKGTFRQDLFFRLSGVRVAIPPLRERTDFRFVLDRILAAESGDCGVSCSAAAAAALQVHAWPGNLRELCNVVRVALAMAEGPRIELTDLPLEYQSRNPSSSSCGLSETRVPQVEDCSGFEQALCGKTVSNDPQQLIEALRENHWNITDTAQALNISRATIYRNMRKFNIVPPNKSGI